MRKLERLAKEARDAATWRGHDLLRGKRLHSHAMAYDCARCAGYLFVTDNPAPNGCEIVGDLVALNCPIETPAPPKF